MTKISVSTWKGGVGKTTTPSIWPRGPGAGRVLLIDADPQARSVTSSASRAADDP
jgi:cellulose biosynthesis protein BcsQ